MNKITKLTDRSAAIMLGGLCSLLYFTSYLSRYSLTACIAEITGRGLLTPEQVGLCTMLLFVFYGAGQLLSGVLGDRFPPERLICIALIGSAAANAVFPFLMAYPLALALLWGAHGLLQAMFWPPIVKLIASRLPSRYYAGSTLAVLIASHTANVVLYLLAAFCVGVLREWRVLFWISTVACLVICVVWIFAFGYFSRRYEKTEKLAPPVSASKGGSGLVKVFVSSGALLLSLGMIAQGGLKEGVTAWLPSYISQVYSQSTSDAILQSVAIPIASIICLVSVRLLYRRVIHNEASGAALLFGGATLMAALILFVPSLPPIAVILCAALMTGCMHGVNLFLIAYLPGRFASYGRTSTISGLTNAFASAGCAAYSYGIAAISENLGWTATAISWMILPAVGLAACLIALPIWKRFLKK